MAKEVLVYVFGSFRFFLHYPTYILCRTVVAYVPDLNKNRFSIKTNVVNKALPKFPVPFNQ